MSPCLNVDDSECASYDAGDSNQQVACGDGNSGSGFILFSVENLVDRGFTVHGGSHDHMVCVRYSGGVWQQDSNDAWLEFTPVDTDLLVAYLDFDADTIEASTCSDETYEGIAFGTGATDVQADYWDGGSNDGEWGIWADTITECSCESEPESGTYLQVPLQQLDVFFLSLEFL